MVDSVPPPSKEEFTRRAEEMRGTQDGIRLSINELEQNLIALSELNDRIGKDQAQADKLQRGVITKIAEILTMTEEQEKRSAGLTIDALERLSNLIQMDDSGSAKRNDREEKKGGDSK